MSGSARLKEELRLLSEENIPESLGFIQAGVSKIDSLLNGLLRFSRLGRAELTIERISMNELLRWIAQAMGYQFQQSGIKLEIEELPDCCGDAGQLDQVFSNLMDNALKYLDPSRPGRIGVSGRIEGDRAVYAVRDNGVGIASAHQSKIFEIFHRLDLSHSTGEGLGLTIAQRALARQGGKIWVESAVGEGSTFLVSLPAVKSKTEG